MNSWPQVITGAGVVLFWLWMAWTAYILIDLLSHRAVFSRNGQACVLAEQSHFLFGEPQWQCWQLNPESPK